MKFSEEEKVVSRWAYTVFAGVLMVLPLSESFGAAPDAFHFRTVSLKAGGRTVRAEVAATDAERERGLMYRKSLPENSGMLFVFDRPARSCMWMKNTAIPLSVAFIDYDGNIVNIEEMKPFTTESHCSAGWIRYALEMNAGWFGKNGLKPGSQIGGLPE